jgi:hypothetical protein
MILLNNLPLCQVELAGILSRELYNKESERQPD